MAPTSLRIPKGVVRILLAFVFFLAFLITPYWRHAETTPKMILVLALTILTGAVWLFVSAEDLQISLDASRWPFPAILSLLILLINLRPFTSVIPWRGDEDYHIENTLFLASQISTKWLLALGVIVLALLFLAWRKAKWALVAGALVLAGMIVILLLKNPLGAIPDAVLFRYPYVNYWFFAIVPKLVMSLHDSPYHEAFFRILPLVAGVALAWACQMYFLPPQRVVDLLWGCAVATIPLLFYYSSILYLEMPAVFLMFLVCMNINSLLQDDFAGIKHKSCWYALILIGFIKETAILFLLCFVGWRLVSFLAGKRGLPKDGKQFSHHLLQEICMALGVLLPAVLYLFLRTYQTHNRSFTPDGLNLVDPTVLQVIGRSYLEQLGLFLLLFLAGCALLLVKREYLGFGFLVSVFLLYPLFFAVDTARYAGYSRFNLFILPPVLAASGWAIRAALTRSRITGLALAGVVIVSNIWISPINWDGTKKPLWGNYLADTSEHYYPYAEALQWLKTNHGSDRILLTGMYYPYRSFSFYFSQMDWEPDSRILLIERLDSEADALKKALAKAETENFNVVLYQARGKDLPQVADSFGYVEEKIFQNDAHMLVVYLRNR